MISQTEAERKYTIAIIKPHAVTRDLQVQISDRIAGNGFVVEQRVQMKMTSAQISALYAEHAGKSFYDTLCKSMADEVIVMKLVRNDGLDPVVEFRQMMGHTNPAFAAPGTLRAEFGNRDPAKLEENAVHGSDSEESAKREFAIFAYDLSNATQM
jgi:nucleoside-diphosphate kinase